MKKTNRFGALSGFSGIVMPESKGDASAGSKNRFAGSDSKSIVPAGQIKEKYEKIIKEMEKLHLQNEKAAREIRAIRHKLMVTRNPADLLQALIVELRRLNINHVSIALALDKVTPDDSAITGLPVEVRRHVLFFHTADLEKIFAPVGRAQARIGHREVVDSLGIFGHRTQSCVMAPMVFRGHVIGSVNLGAISATRFNDDMSPDLLEDLAQTAALCLDNVITHERNEQLAATDALTGIYNRRYFYEMAERTVALANRHGDWVSCLFIDLNDFKKINDQYGHNVGDLALINLAQYIKGRIRQTDVFARLGGDEFAIILPRIAPPDARRLAETLRLGVSQISFEAPELAQLTLSAAFGVTGLQGGQMSLDDLVNRADEAMYVDKANKAAAS